MTERGAHEFATRLMGPLSGGKSQGSKGPPVFSKLSRFNTCETKLTA